MKFYVDGVHLIGRTVIDRSPQRDLALIQLATIPGAAPAVTLATESPDPGERVFTIAANAKGDENCWDFTSGSVRQVSRRHLTNGGIASVVDHAESGGFSEGCGREPDESPPSARRPLPSRTSR
jgi:hypothetical protein